MKSLSELTRRDPAFRERRPDPYRAPPPPGPVIHALEQGAAGVVMGLAAVSACATLVMLLLAALEVRWPWIAMTRPDADQLFINRLEVAVRGYETDTGALPPPTPLGSAALARALTTPDPTGRVWWPVEPGHLDGDGNLRTPSGRTLHYRAKNARGRWGFDLWAGDATGRALGAATWQR